jgi:subtilisin family serine protease
MPTTEYTSLYPKFGVQTLHSNGFYGSGISIYIIDTGLSNTENKVLNVKNRTISKKSHATKQHGSFVASIIADKHLGIAPNAQIYISDVSDASGKIYTSALTAAIKDAIDLRVDIISISLGTDTYNQQLEDTVKKAHGLGILVFAASGNCSCRAYEFPSACDAAISVASIDANRVPSRFNTRNDSVAVFAPGESLQVPGSKTRLSGTSFSVPFASGLAALELQRRRSVDPKASFTRTEAIAFLRETMGLDCETHTYANGPCTDSFCGGSFQETSEIFSGFIGLAIASGFFLGLLSAHLRSSSRS